MKSDSDEEVACALATYILLSGNFLKKKKKRNARKRRWWMGTLNRSRDRYNSIDTPSDLRSKPFDRFENLCRMSRVDFEFLLNRIGPFIAKQNTNMRQSIPIEERLAVTLHFFATGDSYASLSHLFKFSKQTISRCVDEVCQAIIQELQEELKLPENEDDWLNIAQQYEDVWNFPNCLGAIDGKHVIIQCPMSESTEFCNYKGAFSLVLLALVDAHYCFTFVDIGCESGISDGRGFNNSSLFSKLQKDQLKLPPDRKLPSFDKTLPYVFIGNTDFSFSHMMKPYPGVYEKASAQRIFGYQLSRVWHVVENVFGIMSSVFRVFRKPMVLEPEKVRNVTLACVLLHNFMRRSPSSAAFYTPPGTFDTEVDGKIIPGSWRNDQSGMTSFLPLKKLSIKTEEEEEEASGVRDSFTDYFVSSGKLSWLNKYC